MKYCILLAFFLMVTVPAHADGLFNGMDCNGTTPIPENYEMSYFNIISRKNEYYIPDETITLGNVTSPYINYIYKNGVFYNKKISLFGNKDITDTLRFFQGTYGHLWFSKDHSYCWLTDDYAICLKRLGFHLAEVGVFCRDHVVKQMESPKVDSGDTQQP